MRANVYSAETKELKMFSGLRTFLDKPWMKFVFYGLLAIVLELVRFTPYYPDFFFGLVFAFGFSYPGKEGLIFALLFGFFKDYYTMPATGIMMLAYVAVLLAGELRLFRAAPNKFFILLPQYLLSLIFYVLALSFASSIVSWQLAAASSLMAQLRVQLAPLLWQGPLNLLAVVFWLLVFRFVLPYETEDLDIDLSPQEGGTV